MIELSRLTYVNSMLFGPGFQFVPIYTFVLSLIICLGDPVVLSPSIGDNSYVCTALDTLAYDINTMIWVALACIL